LFYIKSGDIQFRAADSIPGNDKASRLAAYRSAGGCAPSRPTEDPARVEEAPIPGFRGAQQRPCRATFRLLGIALLD